MTLDSPVHLKQRPIVDRNLDEGLLPARGFLSLIHHWMGRLISVSSQISTHLYHILFRVQRVASPVIYYPSPIESPLFTKKNRVNVETSPAAKKVPSPIQKKEEINKAQEIEIDDIFEEDEMPIVEGFFNNMGFDADIHEVLSKALIFDTHGKKLNPVDLENLTGEYQFEWNISDEDAKEESNFILLYKGHFKKGMFHGTGAFTKQESDGSLYSLLEGNFENGAFTSGMMVLDDSYIEGTFTKGFRDGKGVIRYFKTDGYNNQITRLEYHGEFINGIPYGKGKVLSIESDSNGSKNPSDFWGAVKLLAEGEFKSGKIIKGRYQEDDGNVFNGTWDGDTFNGRVTNYQEEWDYRGSCLNGKFEGQGQLTKQQKYKYDDLVPETNELTGEEEVILTAKQGQVTCTYKGEFRLGQIFTGEQKTQWPDGKTGTILFENGKAMKTQISTPQGLRYSGIFQSFTLDGVGKICNESGEELYSGSIKCGLPHGKGRKIDEDEIKEGLFEWGNFIESSSPKSGKSSQKSNSGKNASKSK